MLGQPISMLIPPVLGFRLNGRDARRRDRHRPRAHDHRAAAQARRGRQVRRVLRSGPRAPDDCRPRDARQHVPRVRRDDRDLPDRRDDARLPAPDRPRRAPGSSSSRRTRRRRACSGRPAIRIRSTPRRSSSISRRSSPAWRDRAARRIGCRSSRRRADSRARCRRCRHGDEEARRRCDAGCSGVGERQAGAAVAEMPAVGQLEHGAVVIAAITSCTNTSNPSVMIGAGLLARKAVERGLTRQPWVKTSLAPGSKVVTEYLRQAGLDTYLDALGFNLVGYGCTTCIGNSGPLPDEVSAEVEAKQPRGGIGAERQPQLRGAHPAAGARELPGVAAARGRLRAGRADDARPDDRTARHRHEGRAGLPARHLAVRARDSGHHAPGGQREDVPRAVRRRLRRRRAVADAGRADRRSLRVGRGLHLRPQPAVLRRRHPSAVRRSRTSQARGRWQSSATASPPTTSRRRARSRRTAPRAST